MLKIVRSILHKKYGSIELTISDLLNSVFHSLAKAYQQAIYDLESITKITYLSVLILGGGANNEYLNELIELYTKKVVVVHQIEATAIGNLNVQEKYDLDKNTRRKQK